MSEHGYWIIFSDLLFHFGNFFEGEKYAMRTIPVLAVNKSEGLKVEVRTSSGPQLKYNRDHFAILYTLEMWTVEFRFRINCYFRWAVSEIWSQVIVILSRNHPKTGPKHWNFLLCFCDVWGLKWSSSPNFIFLSVFGCCVEMPRAKNTLYDLGLWGQMFLNRFWHKTCPLYHYCEYLHKNGGKFLRIFALIDQ